MENLREFFQAKKILFVYHRAECSCTLKCSFDMSMALIESGIYAKAIHYKNLNNEIVEGYDFVILQRIGTIEISLSEEDRANILSIIEKYYDKKKIVYLIDDLMFEKDEFAKLLIKKCHAVICFNKFMSSLLEKYNNVHSIKTFADICLIDAMRANKKDVLTLVMASTGGLGSDLFYEIAREFQSEEKYHFIYITGKNQYNIRTQKNITVYGILPFDKMIKTLKEAHFLLNPMTADNETKNYIEKTYHGNIDDFLNCKAEIKYVLAGASKTCFLTSDKYAYISAIKNYHNGVLLSGNVNDWVSAIKTLSNDKNLKEMIVSNAFFDVSKNYSFEAAANALMEILRKI